MKSHASLNWKVIVCFLGLSMAHAVSSDEIVDSEQWRAAPSLPYRIQEIYPALFSNHIVVAGGLSPDVGGNRIGVSDRVLVYSLDSQSWMDGPQLPAPRHHPMLVVIENRLLSFGGFTQDEQGIWHNSVDVLELVLEDASTNADLLKQGRWKKTAQMPAPLAETLSAVHSGRVHLVGGRSPKREEANSQWNDQTDMDSHYVFDLQTLSWSQGKPLPTARNSACSATINGNMHTVGGRTVAGGNLASHEAYDFERQEWRALAALPDAQGGLACAAINNRLYVFGGEYFNNGGGVYADVWEYNPVANRWRSVSKMPNPRHGLGALAIDDSIYVIAGASQAGGNQTSNAMTVFTPHAQK